MKRAGSTVQYQLTTEIVERSGVGKRIGFIKPNEFEHTFDIYKDDEGILVAKLHDYDKGIEKLLNRGEAKAIYVYRDLRDVSISFIEKGQRLFWRFILSGEIDNLLIQHRLWNSLDCILVSRYENMVINLAEETKRIADFLGVELDDDSAEQIAANYSLDRQKQRIESFDYQNKGFTTGVKKKIKVDPYSLLHENHINSGQVGHWKTTLTPIQIGMIEYLGYDWLHEMGYQISQNWVKQEFVPISNFIFRSIAAVRKIVKK